MVSDAIHWLVKNNPHYSHIELNYHALNSLPENDVPNEILSIETDETSLEDNATSRPDVGPVSNEDDIVYNSNTDSSSLLPVNDTQQQEIDFIHQNVSQ